jgi:hypothetical protein
MEPIKCTYWSCNTPDCEEGHATYEEAVACVLESADIREYHDYRCAYCGREYTVEGIAKDCCSVERLQERIRTHTARIVEAEAAGRLDIAHRYDTILAGYKQRLAHRLAMDAKGE